MEYLDSIHHCVDFFCVFVGQVESEVLLHREHELNAVQGVEAELLEGGCPGELAVVALGRRL